MAHFLLESNRWMSVVPKTMKLTGFSRDGLSGERITEATERNGDYSAVIFGTALQRRGWELHAKYRGKQGRRERRSWCTRAWRPHFQNRHLTTKISKARWGPNSYPWDYGDSKELNVVLLRFLVSGSTRFPVFSTHWKLFCRPLRHLLELFEVDRAVSRGNRERSAAGV
jgi:hypothetical protein